MTWDDIEEAALGRAATRYGIPNTPENAEFLRSTSAFAWARLHLSIIDLGHKMLAPFLRLFGPRQ